MNILEKTRTPLTTGFEAAWPVTTTQNGFSAKSLERTLGARYRVAWTILQRFRVAMVRAERAPRSGTVEVDEALIGGVKLAEALDSGDPLRLGVRMSTYSLIWKNSPSTLIAVPLAAGDSSFAV